MPFLLLANERFGGVAMLMDAMIRTGNLPAPAPIISTGAAPVSGKELATGHTSTGKDRKQRKSGKR